MQDMLESVQRFVAAEVAPQATAIDRTEQLPEGLWDKLAAQGLSALAVPTRWGGVEADLPLFAACFETLGAACASTAWTLLAHALAARALAVAGTPEQQERLLPGLASGQLKGSALVVTEAGGGSNPAVMGTRARRDGRQWQLDGSKQFISLAGAADLYVVMARTADTPGTLACFLVESGDAGFSCQGREDLLGVRGVPVGSMLFEQCRLPEDRLLGAENGGFGLLGAAGGWGMVGAAAAALGMAQASVQEVSAYLREREVGGAVLSSQPGVQQRLAQMHGELTGARARLDQAIASLGRVPGPPLALFTAKVEATEAAVRVIDICLGLYGGIGYSRELPLERRLRDVRAFTIHWGNNEVMRDSVRKMLAA